ncbi:nitronate monooxygenase family protein [Dechloromonas sp. XY25]|uniref:Nitronate monooxygenase family protein n=1 Tax=Dechloromonas hankyongensis TaxID=2908002 RepID=A0ABS9K2B3_9RHOO|nr:nitronate monooxygenase family protein [Dechloromonas hankyongensis]MCG2577285.1 nitronate monooxygenase family protein [Dechloromonas hankyongensis]
MPIPASLNKNLTLPAICAPMFIVSNPDLVIAQCKAGVIGSFPALNARPKELLDAWLTLIKAELATDPHAAPFAVNQIIHPSNERLEHDMALCVQHEVPLIITSLSAPTQIVPHVHAYGGKVFHDVISVRHAEKALEAGVDGLILVCAGAGGHAGTLSPFALVGEIRKFYDGPLALSGSITNGSAILSAQAMGADFAYIGTRFIATAEANAVESYKQAILESAAKDVVYTPYFTGVHGNYLMKSIVAAGLDPANLPEKDKTSMSFGGNRDAAKAWKDIWGAGQGVGTIDEVLPTAELVARLRQEYRSAKAALCSNPF